MPQILFKGKQFIQNYHLGVKFHELVTDKKKSFCADGVGVPGGRLRRDGSIRARARQSHHTSVLVSAESPERDSVEMGHTLSLHDNLIVHGDNLKALKALLPTYAGKVKCVYIDPPYNTGNEKWVYNDNVNSPMMQEWLGEGGGRGDPTAHDKGGRT